MIKIVAKFTNEFGTEYEIHQYGDTFKLFIRRYKLHFIGSNSDLEYLKQLAN